MANKDDYLTYYREFFENFAQTVNPNDQLPVKLACYKIVNSEVVGSVIDWCTQYLSQKKCPPNLFAPIIKIIIEEVRKTCKKNPVNCGFNPADNAYDPLKLMHTVMAKTNEVCLRYLDNSMLCSLPSPDMGSPRFVTSVCSVKNTRRTMEDRHVIVHDLNTMFNIQEASPSSYYAIFDGHAGQDAATYGSAHLHQFLAENKNFVSNPKQALFDAFCKTDVFFIYKCKIENLNSGTTAVVALLRPKEKMLYVAWAGDSQALLVSRERTLQLVNPHKPCRDDERERIEKHGGCVMKWGTWRVNGQLAVSRSIGDPEHKPFVIAAPDIEEVLLDGDDFLVLACDGLWDTVSDEAVAKAVYNFIYENPDDTDRISQRLVQLAKEQGSTDNISVIVVFLREPSKIAAEAHWANRNVNTSTMEEGLNNANNPFGVANGATTDNIITQKTDGLMLNLSDKFKQNGTDLASPVDLFEKSNGKRPASEFDDDDFGPETNVDTVDDILSPGAKEGVSKSFADGFPSPNNNPLLEEGVFNPFMEHQEKAALEMEKNMRKRETRDEFDDEDRAAREETPTPPADAAHDVSGLVENQADSESEDEWNYIKGEEANKENLSPQPEKEVADIPEEDDTMSQLNPNAAEFVPVSPTRSIPSPVCRMLINDPIISQSPNKAKEIDINLPNPKEFENEVKLKPSEIDSCNNGLNENDDHNTSKELMENILNGKNIDEIPEFQPGSTPKKVFQNEGFHFGPNAASFTTPKILDQSEALSTQAVFGDDTTATLDHSFNDSAILNKESDPMSMSFYAENPFDLNKVQQLPNNLDDFLNEPDDSMKDSTPDLEEYLALGDQNKSSKINNDDAIQVTDLDKHSFDDEEKELASPLEQDKELLSNEEIEATKTPEPTHENLLDGVIGLPEKRIEDDFELIPEDASEVTDLLKTGTETLPKDVELIPSDLLSSERSIVTDSLVNVLNLPPEPKIVETETPICDITYKTDLPLPQPRPICRLPVELYQNQEERTSPVNDAEKPDLIEEFQPHTILPGGCYVRTESKSSTCDLSESKSPLPEEPMSAGSEDFTRPEFLQQAQDKFDELCKPLESPQEDVTSSVKDDLSENTDSFIAKSPYEDKVINETLDERVSKDGESYVLEKEFAQDSLIEAIPPNDSHREELILADDISADPEQVVKICMFPPERLGPSKDVEEFIPSAVTTENASPDLIEPIAAGEEPSLNLFTAKPIICICPCPPKRIPYIKPDENIPFVVETENIAPEFAEPAVVTPSEESKTEDVVEPQQKEGLLLEVTAIGAALAVATVAPLLTDLKAEEEKKPADKKKSLSAKKTPSKTTPVKNLTATTAKSLASPVTSKMSTPTPKSAAKTSPKVPAPKIGSAKPTSPTAAPKPSPRASLSRPTPTTKAPTAKPQPIPKTQPASKPTATKLTNGETKFNKPLTARKVLSEPTSKLITKSSASATSKPTSKVPKTNAAVKTAAPPTQTRPPTAPSRISSAAKKPATLTKMTNETTDQKDGAAKVPSTKPLASKVFPKPRLAPSSAPPKPKTLTMKTETKVQPDSQKQIKDSANKITAARNVIQRKVPASANTSTANTRTTTASARTITSARRVESKVSSARTTVTKSTTSTTKAPTGKKKSTETVNATLTKTTKIEKPKENGLPTVVTEEIRIVSNASRELNNSKNIADNEQPLLINVDKQEIDVSNKVDETSPDLIKDNSPVDNKIIETQQLIHANAD